MDRRAYEEAVRDEIVDVIGRHGYEDTEFRLDRVTLEREYPHTRFVIYFRRDDPAGQLFGYWGSIWEIVAWHWLNAPPVYEEMRSKPAYVGSEIFLSMDAEFSHGAPPAEFDPCAAPDEPWAPQGVRWIHTRCDG